MSTVSNHLLTLLLPRMFGAAVLGWYSLGQRVTAVPFNLVGTAVGEVFRSDASREFAEHGHCLDSFRRTVKHLIVLGAGPFLVLLIGAPGLFAFVFGEEWRPAGEIVRVLSLVSLLRFIALPLTHTFLLARRQREDFWLQAWALLSGPLALWLGYRFFGSLLFALACFAVSAAIVYGVYLVRSYRFARFIPERLH